MFFTPFGYWVCWGGGGGLALGCYTTCFMQSFTLYISKFAKLFFLTLWPLTLTQAMSSMF